MSKEAKTATIDRDKLRGALRHLGDEYVFYMLDAAIDLLPPTKLAKIVRPYLDMKRLRSDAPETKTLLAEVKAFDAASRAGKYYESFDVNSQNFTSLSKGTRAFIADCNRLFARCVAQVSKGDPAEIREAIEILLGVLRYVDECEADVIFFADEAGAWQVGVDWGKVFPAWFLCQAFARQASVRSAAHRPAFPPKSLAIPAFLSSAAIEWPDYARAHLPIAQQPRISLLT